MFSFVNDLERPVGAYLYGRQPPFVRDFTEIWRGANKIVYSQTLNAVSSKRTRLERSFDPEAVRHLKATAAHGMTLGGAGLAGTAIAAGLVDELHLLAVPVVVGGGKSWLPTGVRLNLTLVDTRRFANGVVYCSYRPRA